MQQKRNKTRWKAVVMVALVVLVASIGKLVMTDIPAPQHPVEKHLDVKDFLEQKQP